MVTPPLRGYPVDRTIIRRRQRERHEHRVRTQAGTSIARVARRLNERSATLLLRLQRTGVAPSRR
jgi:hypothetical protein